MTLSVFRTGINMAKIVLTSQKVAPPLVQNEHVNPRFYLNKFADSKKQVIVYAKDRVPRRTSTKSQSSEQDYFEYTINGQATQNRYENWFQRNRDRCRGYLRRDPVWVEAYMGPGGGLGDVPSDAILTKPEGQGADWS